MWQKINVGAGNGLGPSGNKLLSESMAIEINDAV